MPSLHMHLLHQHIVHADIPAAESIQLQELEGTTQLPQHKLELVGKHKMAPAMLP